MYPVVQSTLFVLLVCELQAMFTYFARYIKLKGTFTVLSLTTNVMSIFECLS